MDRIWGQSERALEKDAKMRPLGREEKALVVLTFEIRRRRHGAEVRAPTRFYTGSMGLWLSSNVSSKRHQASRTHRSAGTKTFDIDNLRYDNAKGGRE